LFGDAGLEGEDFLIVGEAHLIEGGRDRIEVFTGKAQQLLAFDKLLLGEFPAIFCQMLGAAALGFDGGDVNDEVLGFGGGEAGDELHFEARLEFEIDDAFDE